VRWRLPLRQRVERKRNTDPGCGRRRVAYARFERALRTVRTVLRLASVLQPEEAWPL
jgi:hypothetical protein